MAQHKGPCPNRPSGRGATQPLASQPVGNSRTIKNDKRTIFGWAMYDWANSAYATAIAGAILPAFFADEIVAEAGYDVFGVNLSGQAMWGIVTGGGAFLLFLVMPILGAIADFSATKRAFMMRFAVIGAVFTMALGFMNTGMVLPTLALFLLAQISFVAANVFYDGFLPDISTDATIDRVSSKGFALGYMGGGIQLVLASAVILLHESLGISENAAVQIGIGSAGIWWLAFGLFSFTRIPETGTATPLPAEYAGKNSIAAYTSIGFRRTIATAKKLLGFKQMLLFIIAFMLYNDGVQTTIAMTSVYASDTLNLEIETILVAFLIVQFIAFFGALAFGVIADRVGAKRGIMITLVVWSAVAIGAYFLPEGEAMPFWILATVVGFILGGVQALSRSLYGSMIPEEASAEFYGFYSVFAKFSAIWGPLIFAVISTVTDSGRPAILSIIVFFILGMILLSKVDIEEARASRERWSFEGVEAEVVEK
jgi:MFS transporter, UMF1 family